MAIYTYLSSQSYIYITTRNASDEDGRIDMYYLFAKEKTNYYHTHEVQHWNTPKMTILDPRNDQMYGQNPKNVKNRVRIVMNILHGQGRYFVDVNIRPYLIHRFLVIFRKRVGLFFLTTPLLFVILWIGCFWMLLDGPVWMVLDGPYISL